MRHLFLSAFALFLAMNVQADPIEREEAAMLASQYVKNGNAPRLVHSMRRTRPLRTQQAAATSAPLYIFSRGEGMGFVIVAGDNCVNPIIGVTDSGDYDPASLPPALVDMLEGWGMLIEEAQAQGAPARTAPRKAAGTHDIPVLLTSHWHQSSPYNDKCPYLSGTTNRALTGCVATAAAQVAYYWRNDAFDAVQYDTPTYGYGDAPVTEEFQIKKGTPYNWDLMIDSYGGNSKQREAVATMVAALGMSTWLTYGSSTSGQISELVNTFSGQFNLSSTCWYKSGNSQSSWEKLVVNELEESQPIVYSGVHKDNGGHAIVLDGYRYSDNMFHFNFGWGGQGDGYYSLDDETGVNGFAGQQGMTFQIKPKKFNLNASVKQNGFIQKADNKFTVVLENNSSIPYSGVYVFMGTSSPAYSDITKASIKNEDIVVPKGEKMEIEFSYKPSLLKPYIMVVADKNGRLLARDTVEVTAAKPDLKLNWIKVMDATQSEDETITVDGKEQTVNVGHVFNTSVDIETELYNSPSGTYVQPQLKVELYTYDAEKGEWATGSTKTVSTTVFDSDDTQHTIFPFTKLKEGTLYKARLQDRILTDTYYYIDESTADSVAYFRVQASDLAITKDGGTAVLTGAWNAKIFNTLATDESINIYDLTAVDNFGGDCSSVATANPNAMIYASSEAEGNNIIVNGRCRNLTLVPGYDFTPLQPFNADHATYKAAGQTGIWTTVYLPFAITAEQMTEDMLVRNALSIQSGFFYTCDSVCRDIKACTPYLVVPGRETLTLKADNVEVNVNAENAFSTDFTGTFVTIPAVKNTTWVLDEGTTQYFNTPTSATIPAFSGYIVNSTKKVRANSYTYSTKDQSSVKLGKALIAAQQTLDETECSQYAAEMLQEAIEEALLALSKQESKAALDNAVKALNAAVKEFEAEPLAVGISKPTAKAMDGKTYDLSGRPVQGTTRHGIYIKNGKITIK